MIQLIINQDSNRIELPSQPVFAYRRIKNT